MKTNEAYLSILLPQFLSGLVLEISDGTDRSEDEVLTEVDPVSGLCGGPPLRKSPRCLDSLSLSLEALEMLL